MWAMTVKEFRQLRRDHRAMALMVVMPIFLLVVFGYAARFDISDLRTITVGSRAGQVAERLPAAFDVVGHRDGGREQAVQALRDGDAVVALVANGAGRPEILIDGSQMFPAQSALRHLGGAAAGGAEAPGGAAPRAEVLFNPELKTSTIMIPGLMGMVLVFIGTIITSLGIVRERQAGTLEQLSVMPLRPRDVIVGKVLPYFGVAIVDLVLVVSAGLLLFDVPFEGSWLVFALAALLFLLATLGSGVLVSTVSENQGQTMLLSLMTIFPQVMLSGLIFPLESMAAGVRWIGYLFPLTYFLQVARGVLVRGAPLNAMLFPIGMIALLGVAIFTLSILRFRRDLTPKTARAATPGEPAAPETAGVAR
jgi:ABC-2 type transport system permease protein